jgi:hypothetical protein
LAKKKEEGCSSAFSALSALAEEAEEADKATSSFFFANTGVHRA